ncbi:hypothetical protein PUR29_35485 [Methylobacterium ajmalii]|uniref:Uncharacterized protein n=1 Tax=Methylobacterium ajmalii TaxID=2738439 RepID=A0ABV0A4H5_9HYPH|nr:hypothetical protein [uncultured Methylobacterium sp.]HEV2542240.1 hypothetical protein [Methylobacterium sp.]
MSFGRRLIAAAVAFVLAAVMVVPLLADARHEAVAPVAHAVLSFANHNHNHAADQQDADELIHHAQSHAQGVMPAETTTPVAVDSTAVAFLTHDEPGPAGDRALGPFEPPRD